MSFCSPLWNHPPQHPDEAQYAWSAGYFSGLIERGELARGTDQFLDPGWDPESYWGRAMGTRWIYALALQTTGAEAPLTPYSWTEARLQGPGSFASDSTLRTLRWFGAVCAALGAALFALRLGWHAVLAALVVIAFPRGASTWGRSWAEGPLMLGFGLCAVAWGTRWFGVALGVAGTFKLTAVGLWPLALLRRAGGGVNPLLTAAVTAAVWTALTPPSWFAGGPLDLLHMIEARADEFRGQSEDGLFIPFRYVWPLVFLGTIALSRLAWPRVDRRLERMVPGSVATRLTPNRGGSAG